MKSVLLIVFHLSSIIAISQSNKNCAAVYPESIVHKDYGVNMYVALEERSGGDSIRMCSGKKVTGWVEDYYANQAVLHKGYYSDGKIRLYKNFYPTGELERDYTVSGDHKSAVKAYYKDGTLRMDIQYVDGSALEWHEYFHDGSVSFSEVYDKNMEYYLEQKSYYHPGKPQSIMVITDKKQKKYDKKEYYESGQVSAEGIVYYNTDLMSYMKAGTWKYFDESGKLTKEERYENGKIAEEKKY